MTDSSAPIDLELLERYLDHQCTPEERVAVDAAAAADRRVEAVLRTVRTLPAGPYSLGTRVDGEMAWLEFSQRRRNGRGRVGMGMGNYMLPLGKETLPRSSGLGKQTLRDQALTGADVPKRTDARKGAPYGGRLPVWGRIRNTSRSSRSVAAGVMVIVAVAGLVFGRQLMTPAEQTTADTVYATGDQPMQIRLPDGSGMTLAPRSRCVVAKEFGTEDRVVHLTGEAYFDIQSASKEPFLVRTGAVTTRVLGTQFLVRYVPPAHRVQVAVRTGRVAIGVGQRATTVTAGTFVSATDSAVTTTSREVTPYIDWTSGQLVFDDTPVTVMLSAVGKWYGYTFTVTDSTLAKRRVMTVLRTNEREKTLTAIQQLLDVTMSFDGSAVTLRPRRGGHTIFSRPGRRVPFISTGEVGK
jgi:transmembrane sensor